MTESHSPEEVGELDAQGRRTYTHAILTVYRDAALANYSEAEELINRALELRDASHAMLERAGQIAYQYALDDTVPEEAKLRPEDDIAW